MRLEPSLRAALHRFASLCAACAITASAQAAIARVVGHKRRRAVQRSLSSLIVIDEREAILRGGGRRGGCLLDHVRCRNASAQKGTVAMKSPRESPAY